MATAEVLATEQVTNLALAWPDRARAIVINSPESYTGAAETLKAVKALRGEVDAAFDPIIAANFRAHRTACDQKKKAEAPLAEAEGLIKNALVAYDQEQRRLAAIEEQRLRDEARQRDEAAALERAALLEAEGSAYGDEAMVAEAHQIVEEAIQAPAPAVAPVPRATPAVSGISYRKTWKYRITNPNLLPRQYLVPDDKKIGGVVRSLGKDARIPGVDVYEEQTVAAGRA